MCPHHPHLEADKSCFCFFSADYNPVADLEIKRSKNKAGIDPFRVCFHILNPTLRSDESEK